MFRIAILSEINKGSPTRCFSIASRKGVVASLSNIARGSVGSCVITIKRLRKSAASDWAAPMPRPTHCSCQQYFDDTGSNLADSGVLLPLGSRAVPDQYFEGTLDQHRDTHHSLRAGPLSQPPRSLSGQGSLPFHFHNLTMTEAAKVSMTTERTKRGKTISPSAAMVHLPCTLPARPCNGHQR
jgi:hypothetical protein